MCSFLYKQFRCNKKLPIRRLQQKLYFPVLIAIKKYKHKWNDCVCPDGGQTLETSGG